MEPLMTKSAGLPGMFMHLPVHFLVAARSGPAHCAWSGRVELFVRSCPSCARPAQALGDLGGAALHPFRPVVRLDSRSTTPRIPHRPGPQRATMLAQRPGRSEIDLAVDHPNLFRGRCNRPWRRQVVFCVGGRACGQGERGVFDDLDRRSGSPAPISTTSGISPVLSCALAACGTAAWGFGGGAARA